MNIIEKIGDLIHYGSSNFNPLKFRPPLNRNFIKPQYGLWTSPINSEYGWKDWCIDNDFRNNTDENSFKLRLKHNCRVLVIDSIEDLNNIPFQNNTISIFPCPDFEKIFENYDVIWLTVKGESDTRWSSPNSLYGWDCETVYIMNPNCFEII